MESTNNQTPARSGLDVAVIAGDGGALEVVGELFLALIIHRDGDADAVELAAVLGLELFLAAAGITKASKAFMLDAVIDEDAERLTKDMEENPGIAISIGNKLTEILGLTGTANLKKL